LDVIDRKSKIANFLNDDIALPSNPNRPFFYGLQSLDDRAFYVRNLIREHLRLDWVIAEYPKSSLFTNEDLFDR
jgi:hypothetical protein